MLQNEFFSWSALHYSSLWSKKGSIDCLEPPSATLSIQDKHLYHVKKKPKKSKSHLTSPNSANLWTTSPLTMRLCGHKTQSSAFAFRKTDGSIYPNINDRDLSFITENCQYLLWLVSAVTGQEGWRKSFQLNAVQLIYNICMHDRRERTTEYFESYSLVKVTLIFQALRFALRDLLNKNQSYL